MSESGLPEKAVTAIQGVFRRHVEVEEVLLYGSRAKGSFKNGSDIDLTISRGCVDAALLFRLEDELDELMLPYEIDLSLFCHIENAGLIEHIERVGRVFYRGGSGD